MSETPLLYLDNINVFYDRSHILFGVSMFVQKGRTVALLGRNGAGKSTTLKAISGVAGVRSGMVCFKGQEIQNRPPHQNAISGIGYVPEDRQVFVDHSVDENLKLAIKPDSDGRVTWDIDTIYDAFPILAGMQNRRAGALSGGEQQLLSIARCLMGNPTLLLLDEPSEGLAPVIVQEIGRLIRKLRETGITIVLAEQNMHFCLGISEDAVVIDKGQIVFADTIKVLKESEDISQRYLAI